MLLSLVPAKPLKAQATNDLVSISARMDVGSGEYQGYASFTIEGTQNKDMLVRGIGPTLSSYGLSGVLSDPEITVSFASNVVAENIGWGGSSILANAFNQVGAFSLPAGSLDSALLLSVPPDTYSVSLSGKSGDTGLALLELYSVDSAARVAYVAVRGDVGAGNNAFIVGFAVGSTSPHTFLFRELGPALGLQGEIQKPELLIYSSSGTFLGGSLFGWGSASTSPAIVAAENTAGLQTLADGSADNAFLLTLPPGSYTAQVSGVASPPGIALFEVAEIDSERATNAAPSIVSQSHTFVIGQGAAIGVVAVGLPAPTFQWQFNGVNIPGATGSIIIPSNQQLNTGGSFTVTVSNVNGSVVSLPVAVTPVTSITTQPVSQTVILGSGVSFSVGSTGTLPLTYQWYFNNAPIYGATASTYSIASTQLSNAGTYTVVVSSSGGNVTSLPALLAINSPPVFTTQPTAQTANSEATAVFWAATSGTAPLTYQWNFAGSPINGANSPVLELIGIQPSNVGSYTVTVNNTAGSVTSSPVALTLNSTSTVAAPVFLQQPISQTMATGSTVALIVAAGLPGAATPLANGVSYQWFLNGEIAIPGANQPIYVINNTNSSNIGSYNCLAVTSSGSVLSTAATLAIINSSNPGRLVNISCRAQVGTGANQLIAGFVVGGSGVSGADPVLIRASGPALNQFGVTGLLPDPELQLNNSTEAIDANDGWAGNTQVASEAASVGAFAWNSTTSHDSAVFDTLYSGSYTAEITGASGDTGIALAEVYDATPSGAYTSASPRIINISSRVQVGTGTNILIAGFVIGGATSKTVLVRASGPALAAFGVIGTLADPELQLFRSNSDGTSTLLASDTGWAADTHISAAATSVGAFSWGPSATPDSAILITLPPGAYTAQVSGASKDTGIALVEVYDVQ